MIVSTLEQVQIYLPSINFKVDIDRLTDFLDRAEQWLTEHIIGTDIREALDAAIPEGQADPHAEIRKVCSRAICEFAYLTVSAEMDLQLSEAGFVVQENNGMVPASQQRTERLVSSLNLRLNMDCDELVNYLLANSKTTESAYHAWRETEQFNYLTLAFVPTRMQLSRHLTYGNNIGNWQDYFNGIQLMAKGVDLTASPYVSLAEINRLRGLYRAGTANAVQLAAIGMLQDVAAATFVKDAKAAREAAIHARGIMLESKTDFTEFEASECMPLTGVHFNEGHIVDTM